MEKTKVKELDIGKYANKIDFNCCNHGGNRNKYFLGYTGWKCCKVAICLDCDQVQFVGNKFGKIIYPIVRMIFRNRIEVLETIDIEPMFDER